MLWDLFCRVIDHHGDLGVCWRLAADLASRGEQVRLWVDDPIALAWMAPQGAAGVSVIRWIEPLPTCAPGDVVVEAFGCDPPAAFVERMASAPTPPVWIDLEYLSAEGYAERSHGRASPQSHGPGAGLTRWFFFPGFTEDSGGLLRDAQSVTAGVSPGAARERARHELGALGLAALPGERIVSLFAYADAPFAELLDRLDTEPTLLLLTAGAAQEPALAHCDAARRRGRHLRVHPLPWLDQPGYDRLLRACDLNFARGEDSIVRCMWAGAPFVWHIYKQADQAHAAKLEALLERLTAGADPALAERVRAVWRAWNRLGPWPEAWPAAAPWLGLAQAWRERLLAQTDLCTRLMHFAARQAQAGDTTPGER